MANLANWRTTTGKRHQPEEIIAKLRQVEGPAAQSQSREVAGNHGRGADHSTRAPYSLEQLRTYCQVRRLRAQELIWIVSTLAYECSHQTFDNSVTLGPAQAFAVSGLLSVVWAAKP